jgi:hypothetical protein
LLPSFIFGIISIWGIRQLGVQLENKSLENGVYLYIAGTILKYIYFFNSGNITFFFITAGVACIGLVTLGIGHLKLTSKFGSFPKVLGLFYLLIVFLFLISSKNQAIIAFSTQILIIVLLFRASNLNISKNING